MQTGDENMSPNYFNARVTCPGCRSNDLRNVYSAAYHEDPIKRYVEDFYSAQGKIESKYLADAHYTLLECNKCGIIFQKEIPNNFLSNKIYEEWINPQKTFEKYELTHDFDYYSQLAQEIIMIIKYFQVKPSALKFLDFGMGWGNWCRIAQAFGCEVKGMEISESRIKYAQSQGISAISWNQLSDQKFDFINIEQVLEHLSDPLETMISLKKYLKGNGIVKISVPCGDDIKNRLAIMDWSAPKSSPISLNPVAPLEHINCFNTSSLNKMAFFAGFQEIDMPIQVEIQSYSKNSYNDLLKNCWKWTKKLFKRTLRFKVPSSNNGTYRFFKLKNN